MDDGLVNAQVGVDVARSGPVVWSAICSTCGTFTWSDVPNPSSCLMCVALATAGASPPEPPPKPSPAEVAAARDGLRQLAERFRR